MWLASCARPAISSTTLLFHENRTDVLLSILAIERYLV